MCSSAGVRAAHRRVQRPSGLEIRLERESCAPLPAFDRRYESPSLPIALLPLKDRHMLHSPFLSLDKTDFFFQ
jgi:hypothetical protein